MERTVVALVVVLAILAIAVGGPALHERLTRQRFAVERARPVRAAADGEQYKVHTTYRAHHAAANLLANVHGRVIDIIRHMRAKYVRGNMGAQFPYRQKIAQRLLENYDPDSLTESAPHNPDGDTAFSQDKGRVLAICLREKHAHESGDPEAYDLHDLTTVMFVTVHELAHLGTAEFGHPPKFWSCFKLLLLEAEECGAVPERSGRWPNYFARPVRYCGTTIDYTPVLDPEVVLPQ